MASRYAFRNEVVGLACGRTEAMPNAIHRAIFWRAEKAPASKRMD